MAKITLKLGDRVLKDVFLEDVVTIGRKSDNQIHIDNLAVSGTHAIIIREGDSYFIEDQESLNGTFVDAQKVTRALLQEGTEITIGKHTLVFSETARPPAQKASDQPSFDKTMVLDTKKHKEMAGLDNQKVSLITGILSVIEGNAEQDRFEFSAQRTTIGKSPTAVVKLKGLFAPQTAADLLRTKDGFVLSPPTGGKMPKLNGVTVNERTRLKDGDVIEAGGATFRFNVKHFS